MCYITSMKNLPVQDENVQVECEACSETPGKVWSENLMETSGKWEECPKCEGTGMVDVPVEITKIPPAFSATESQFNVILKGL